MSLKKLNLTSQNSKGRESAQSIGRTVWPCLMPFGAELGCLFHPDIQLSAVKLERLVAGCNSVTRVLVLVP